MKVISYIRRQTRNRIARGFLLALPAIWFCCSASAQAAINLVHVTNCGPGPFPGTTCAIPATGNGNLIVVGWQIAGGANTSTVIKSMTDNKGNVYAEAGAARAIDTSVNTVIDIWYAKNSISGATAITLTPSLSATRAGAVIWEFSGVDRTAPLDTTAVLNSQQATTTPKGASVTTSAANDVIVSIAEVAGTVTGIKAGNAFTNVSSMMVNGWAHLIASSAGTYFAQWNQDSAGSYDSSTVAFRAEETGSGGASACDLNSDGKVNVVDTQLVVNMYLGKATCTANITAPGVCDQEVVNDVVASALGGTCPTSTTAVPHSVSLDWVASTSANIAGYNLYRGSTSGGPYTKVTSSLAIGTSYTDNNVQAGQTYYYVATAVDDNNSESAYSNQAKAVVPSP